MYRITRFISGLFAFCVMWGATGFFAAWLGIYNGPAVMALSLALFMVALWRQWIPDMLATARHFDRRALAAALLLCLTFSVLGTICSHDTFFLARDEGLYSNGAVYLSEHGGFYPINQDIDVRRCFYTTWLAGFHGLGGFGAMRFSVLLTLFFGLLGIYMLYSEGRRRPWLGVILIACLGLSYNLAWFPRRTLSENAVFLLFWPGMALIARSLRDPVFARRSLWLTTAALGLAAFSRIEDLLPFCLFFATFTCLFLRDAWFKWDPERRISGPFRLKWHQLGIFLLVGLLVVVMCLAVFWGTYNKRISSTNLFNRGSKAGPDAIRSHYPLYVSTVLWRFGLLVPILFIPFYMLALLLDRWLRLLAVIFLPLLILNLYFFYRPNIHLDLPWLLRRFTVFLIPLGFLAFFSLLSYLRHRWTTWVPAAAMLALTAVISFPVFFYSDYHGVREAVTPVIESIPDDSVVLVDRYALGDYFLFGLTRMDYGKEAIRLYPWGRSIFNASDLSEYQAVYMITSKESLKGRYNNKITFIQDESGQPVRVTSCKIAEVDVSFHVLQSEAVLNRGQHSTDWPRLPYQEWIDAIRIPSTKNRMEYHLVLLELQYE